MKSSKTSNQRTNGNRSSSHSPFFGGKHEGSYGFGLSAKGPSPAKVVNFGGPVALRGLTEADYSNNSWALANERGRQGSGCEGCTGRDCVQYSATVRSTFRVSTTVTLPNMSDYADYTECQRRRIRDAINNQLAPHEQQHVAAFRTYNGTVDTPIAMTGCRSELEGRVAARAAEIHLGVEGPRRASAQAASDALDPFVINPDLNCT
ncbi:MAG: hypothetical protein HY842_13925 [Bacteroidetes bacterium]|nr:hypothetical protein [Bacteroidota bacterium]